MNYGKAKLEKYLNFVLRDHITKHYRNSANWLLALSPAAIFIRNYNQTKSLKNLVKLSKKCDKSLVWRENENF